MIQPNDYSANKNNEISSALGNTGIRTLVARVKVERANHCTISPNQEKLASISQTGTVDSVHAINKTLRVVC